jgi:hypothetical protein
MLTTKTSSMTIDNTTTLPALLKTGPHTWHSTDAERPHTSEASFSHDKRDNDRNQAAEKSASRPLTPREKIEAITPTVDKTSGDAETNVSVKKSGRDLVFTGGHLPITHRASRAPARQSLELCHGKCWPHPSQALSATPFMMKYFGC